MRRLTDTPNNAASGAPAWSPAGNQIAYESNADGSFEIYTIDATATASFGTRRSANALGQNYQNPSWSPDAARIAFERGSGTNVGDTTKEIWTMRADGSDPVQLTTNSFYDVQPAYSPDGSRIAYESNEGGEREIYTRPATAGGTSMTVTSTSAGAADEQPDWGWGGPATPRGPLRLADLDDPTLGVDVNVEPVSGTVLVGIRGAARAAGLGRASQKGITFVPLAEARQVPVGSFLDTRKGTVRMESAREQSGHSPEGYFLELPLPGPAVAQAERQGSDRPRPEGRQLQALRHGRPCGQALPPPSAAGRSGACAPMPGGASAPAGATAPPRVRGTAWDMVDRCDGTLTRVKRGRVVVRDFRRKRNITLTAGKSYLAKAPG